MNKKLNILFIGLFISLNSYAQLTPDWDDPSKKGWDSAFTLVKIPSSVDGKMQKAFIYSAVSKTPKPLIVSLHTWSGDYAQEDPLIKEVMARNWNYIHPDFRGPNNNPEAGGSSMVISDLEDAINYAVNHTNTDAGDVHIIGVSGGGYATLLAYMNVRYPVKSFSAWAPISDLQAWYWESIGRKQKYAADILNIVSEDDTFNPAEAFIRSPINHYFPKDLRKDAMLFIYEGIHDGYKGSVPITHAINMYNRLVGDLKHNISELDQIMKIADTDPDLVSENVIINLLSKRYDPDFNKYEKLFDRNTYLSNTFQNITLKIFEGGHEQISQALGLIPFNFKTSLINNILIIGDSNAENEDGWVDQMKKMMPNSIFINKSQGGRTIGFDNLGFADLNALSSIERLLDEAHNEIGNNTFDYIIVCLGTNDTKNEYAEQQNEVLTNFESLLKKIKSHTLSENSIQEFVYVTPPPIGTKIKGDKYAGANGRIAQLIPNLSEIASQKGFRVVNIYDPLLDVLDYYAFDGVHMVGEGQEIIAQRIIEEVFNPY